MEDGDEVIKPSVVTVKVIIKLTFTYTDVTFKYQFKVKETLSEPECLQHLVLLVLPGRDTRCSGISSTELLEK